MKINKIVPTKSNDQDALPKTSGSIWNGRRTEHFKGMNEPAYVRQQPWYKKIEVIAPLAMLGIGAVIYFGYRCMPTNPPMQLALVPYQGGIDPDHATNLLKSQSWENQIEMSQELQEIDGECTIDETLPLYIDMLNFCAYVVASVPVFLFINLYPQAGNHENSLTTTPANLDVSPVLKQASYSMLFNRLGSKLLKSVLDSKQSAWVLDQLFNKTPHLPRSLKRTASGTMLPSRRLK